MNLAQLKKQVEHYIADLKDNGRYPKENDRVDYKTCLNIQASKNELENFCSNFAKDILSFSNMDGGIILIGIKEDKAIKTFEDVGLDDNNLYLLKNIDLNDVMQKFERMVGTCVNIDLQAFQISTRKFYYLIIGKQENTLIPVNDFIDYKISKGAVYYRSSGKNDQANSSTAKFNQFIHLKANEKSKEFMEIWSKLLPEMVDINPREVLILNPIQNKVYGFNSRDKTLSGSEIEIDKTQNGVFNIILNAITAGEIGKITTDEGKPLYKIVGEFKNIRQHIPLSTLESEVAKRTKFKFTNLQLKAAIHHLGWVTSADFAVNEPPPGSVNSQFDQYIWIEITDKIHGRTKVYFSDNAIEKLIEVIDQGDLHLSLFGRQLRKNKLT